MSPVGWPGSSRTGWGEEEGARWSDGPDVSRNRAPRPDNPRQPANPLAGRQKSRKTEGRHRTSRRHRGRRGGGGGGPPDESRNQARLRAARSSQLRPRWSPVCCTPILPPLSQGPRPAAAVGPRGRAAGAASIGSDNGGVRLWVWGERGGGGWVGGGSLACTVWARRS